MVDSPVLLIEDSPEDYEATLRAFRACGLENPVHRCADAEEAMDYLHRRGAFINLPDNPPAIILLDLNLPGADGRDILAELKASERFRRIPVIVLTTSSDQRDIDICYQRGANSYIQKPVSFSVFTSLIGQLKSYWFEAVLLPAESTRP